MKISDLAAKPITVELKHPVTKQPLGVTVNIVGKNSSQFKNKFYEIVEKAQAAGQDKKLPAEKMKAAEVQGAELIAHCIVGWSDNEFFEGEYSVDRALQIVGAPELAWVKEQLDAAIVDDSLFFMQ